jgi:hypothetical protein
MPLQTINKTPVSPSIVDTEAYVEFNTLGPRPECGNCGWDNDCPECTNDRGYTVPVVAGDIIYNQFRIVDNYNGDAQVPTAGWKTGSADFWLESRLIFSSGAVLALVDQNIIVGREVGWFKGSYQNLMLDSQKIQDYLFSIGDSSDCFAIEVTSYKKEIPPVTLVFNFSIELPTWLSPTQYNGLFWAVEGEVYQGVNGSWVLTELQGELIYAVARVNFFVFGADEYFPTNPYAEAEKVIALVCRTSFYRFVNCEQTIKIEGLHGESDCKGNYYGGTTRFRDRYRLLASFEKVAHRTDKTTNEDNKVTEFENYELWLLRIMRGMPEFWANRLNNTLLGSTVYIDENEYINFSDVERNNDTGLSWWSSITCERLSCSKTQGCAEVVFTNPIVVCEEPSCPEVGEPVSLVGELGDYTDTAVCGSTHVVPAATVKDTEGNILGQVDAGEELILDCSGGDPSDPSCPPCEPVIVRNSDSTYLEEPASGETLVLEDYTINVILDGVTVDSETVPAMTDIEVNINWV